MIGKAPAERPPARSFHLFGSARAAFGYWLAGAPSVERDVILLPAYIGWSSREGSGVFDPIAASGLRPRFYRLTPDLAIDIDSLRAHLVRADVAVLLLIHYFGHVDPACSTAVRLAREAGVQIVEDAAHAMLSDLIGGTCGRQGDATLYSLHKMVPATGGVLVRNRAATSTSDALPAIWRHDLAAIAVRRRRNAAYLQLQLRDLADEVEILWPNLAEGEIPQTLPLRILRADRDAVYHAMNAAGYGVVSLYHTMISPLTETEFPDAHRLSRSVLNLPVHQDADPASLDAMIRHFRNTLVACRK